MRLTRISTYAAVAGALAAPLALAAPASASGGTGSAYGIAARGPITIPETPGVTSAAAPHDKSLVQIPANPLLDLKVLHVTAKPAYARASVVDLKLARAAVTAHLVTATCVNGRGSSNLADARIGGTPLAANAAPNSALNVKVQGLGTVAVVLNKQVRTPAGLTVTAIELRLPLGPNGQTVSISSATCSRGYGGPTAEPTATGRPIPAPSKPATPPSQAPKPTPVPSDLPVTG